MANINTWIHPIKLTLKYKFSNEYIPEKFDRLINRFREFLNVAIKYDKSYIHLFNSDDIEYYKSINFDPEAIVQDIRNTILANCRTFRWDRFMFLISLDGMAKTSFTGFSDPKYIYRAAGIVFEVTVPSDSKSGFDMSVTILDGVDNSKSEATQNSWIKTKTDLPTTSELKDSETKVNEANESKVDKSEEPKFALDAKAEKAIISVDLNYTQYKNTLRSLGSNITKEDVERLEALAKAIRATSYSIVKPTTPENMLENLMAKGIIKPEFKMAFTSMFDNLIEDPLTYFFAKYEGATTVEVPEGIYRLEFQFERKLFSMCFKCINSAEKVNPSILVKIFKEPLIQLREIRKSYLKDLLLATGDLNTYTILFGNTGDDERSLNPEFYDYFYNKIVAIETLAFDYEKGVFAHNEVMAKCKEIDSKMGESTKKVKNMLSDAKVEIAKLFYNQLQ